MANEKHKFWLTKSGLEQISEWARQGLSLEEIALNMGVSVKTLKKYKKQFTEIEKAISTGKQEADTLVENALLKRALGYEYVERVCERVLNKELGVYEYVLTKEVTKEVKPDISAQIFWLKNRRPEVWRDKKDIEVEAVGNETSELSDEELNERIANIKTKLGVDDD